MPGEEGLKMLEMLFEAAGALLHIIGVLAIGLGAIAFVLGGLELLVDLIEAKTRKPKR